MSAPAHKPADAPGHDEAPVSGIKPATHGANHGHELAVPAPGGAANDTHAEHGDHGEKAEHKEDHGAPSEGKLKKLWRALTWPARKIVGGTRMLVSTALVNPAKKRVGNWLSNWLGVDVFGDGHGHGHSAHGKPSEAKEAEERTSELHLQSEGSHENLEKDKKDNIGLSAKQRAKLGVEVGDEVLVEHDGKSQKYIVHQGKTELLKDQDKFTVSNIPAGTKVTVKKIDSAAKEHTEPAQPEAKKEEKAKDKADDALVEKDKKKTIIEVVKGDITDRKDDAIINAANTELKLAGGVAAAIKTKGGDKVEKACKKIIQDRDDKHLEIGDVVITTGGNLKPKILHAAVMEYGGKATAEGIKTAVKNIIAEAKKEGLKTLAIPALGAGSGGLTAEESAKATQEALNECTEDLKAITKITIVVFDEKTQKPFQALFKKEKSAESEHKLAA